MTINNLKKILTKVVPVTLVLNIFPTIIFNLNTSSATSCTVEEITTTGSSTWSVPAGVTSVDLIVVGGGGGGGGGAWAGGGGGGGVLFGANISVTGSVAISVGAGGTGGLNNLDLDTNKGSNGGDTSFGTAVAKGGGGGGGYAWQFPTANGYERGWGSTGGSAGGHAELNVSNKTGTASNQTAPAGYLAFGNSGGSIGGSTQTGSGGGGAGGSGGGATNLVAGVGGAGKTFVVNGLSKTYAGGGGGGGKNSPAGALGGSGGGGNGGNSPSSLPTNGTANTGGGGGGSGYSGGGSVGANGGSGIVVIAYPTGCITTSGTNPPRISSVSPNTGTKDGGTSLTITGTDFVAGANVSIGRNSCTSVTVVSSTSITCTTPSSSVGTVDIVVINTDNQSGSLSSGFQYTNFSAAAPTVTSITPTTGSTVGGTSVTITGTGFSSGATVSIGSSCSSITVVSATSITCTTGSSTAGAKNVVVTNSDTQSGTLTSGFTYQAPDTTPPVITGDSTKSITVGNTSIATFNANESVTWSISINPSSLFSINSSGELTISSSATASSYTVEITATDSASNSATHQIVITVNAAPSGSGSRGQSQESRNNELANKVSTNGITTDNAGKNQASGPIVFNGISSNANIFVEPNSAKNIPGYAALKVDGNKIEIIPSQTFSGKMTVPVTISENGATITVNIPIVVNPKPVDNAKAYPVNKNESKISWEPSPNAVSYSVSLNGKSICESSTNSCSIPKLLGPNSVLEIVSQGNDGTFSIQQIPAYSPSKPIPVLNINFDSGASKLNKNEIKKLKSFIKLVKQEGFTTVNISAYTDSVGSKSVNQKISSSRAKAVADYLSRYLNVKISPVGSGVVKGLAKNVPAAGARKATISVI